MYIRRKVFSLLHDETGEERYFSTTEINLEEERIFSVDEEDEEKSHRGRNIALGTAAALGTTAATIYGAKKLGARLVKEAAKKKSKAAEELLKDSFSGTRGRQSVADLSKKATKYEKVGETLQKPADEIVKIVKSATDKIDRGVRKAKVTAYKSNKKIKDAFSKKKD